MKQQTLAGFEKHANTTRRAPFLTDMAAIVPCRMRGGAGLPERQSARRPSADRAFEDAADVFSAALVQPVRPGGRRGIVRLAVHENVCGHRSGSRGGAGHRKYRGRGWFNEAVRLKNRTKSKVRAKAEHAIGVIKHVFGFQRVRYRGLAKSLHRLEASAGLANILLHRRRLLNA